LYEKGFFSAEELSHASAKDLIQIRGIAEEKAMQLIETAKKYMASEERMDEISKEALTDAESDTHETVEDSDVQEVLTQETIDEISEEDVPDVEADTHETAQDSDVQEVLKGNADTDEQPSGHWPSVDNSAKDTG